MPFLYSGERKFGLYYKSSKQRCRKDETMTETKRLYYEDVYKKEFTAKVLECREAKKVFISFWMRVLFTRRAADNQAIPDISTM